MTRKTSFTLISYWKSNYSAQYIAFFSKDKGDKVRYMVTYAINSLKLSKPIQGRRYFNSRSAAFKYYMNKLQEV